MEPDTDFFLRQLRSRAKLAADDTYDARSRFQSDTARAVAARSDLDVLLEWLTVPVFHRSRDPKRDQIEAIMRTVVRRAGSIRDKQVEAATLQSRQSHPLFGRF
jgi:hypothetical protein